MPLLRACSKSWKGKKVVIGASCKRPNSFDMQQQFERLADDHWEEGINV